MINKISGIDFPIRFSLDGNLARAKGDDKLLANLKLIITTHVTERVMNPIFGVTTQDHLFDKLQAIDVFDVAQDIKEAIRLFEPRVKVDHVHVTNDINSSTLHVEITFTPKNLGYQHQVKTRFEV